MCSLNVINGQSLDSTLCFLDTMRLGREHLHNIIRYIQVSTNKALKVIQNVILKGLLPSLEP